MVARREVLVLTDEFRHALDLLAGGRHVFLTGKAATGKSTLVRRFMAETDRAVVVAPTGIAALTTSFRRDDFLTVVQTTVLRQLGDDRMTAILNEIREGVLLGHAQEQLNALADADFIPPDDEFWLTLAPTNRLVTARNRQHPERLPGDELIPIA